MVPTRFAVPMRTITLLAAAAFGVTAASAQTPSQTWVEYDIAATGRYFWDDQESGNWAIGVASMNATIFVEIEPGQSDSNYVDPDYFSDGVQFWQQSYGEDQFEVDATAGNGTLAFGYQESGDCTDTDCLDWRINLKFAPGSFDTLPGALPRLVSGTMQYDGGSGRYVIEQGYEGAVFSATAKIVSTLGVSSASLREVPEPASWALMIGGLGLVGGAMRRRRTILRFG